MGGGGGSGHLPNGGFYSGEVAMGSSLPCSLSLAGLRAAVRPVCERHPVSRLEIFGARAEGTALANSDVDLLVEFLPDANPGCSKWARSSWRWNNNSGVGRIC